MGDAETCAEKLVAELTALQPVHASCFMALAGMPRDRTPRSSERFGKDVMPRVDRAIGGLGRVGHAA